LEPRGPKRAAAVARRHDQGQSSFSGKARIDGLDLAAALSAARYCIDT
jgi:hypothetical protein